MSFHFQKQPPETFCNKSVLKNVANFIGKHLFWSLFNKVPCLQACNFINKRLQHRCFCEIFKNTYFEEHQRKACSVIKKRLQNRCFPVKFAKFLRAPTSKNICERRLCIFNILHEYVSHAQKNCKGSEQNLSLICKDSI